MDLASVIGLVLAMALTFIPIILSGQIMAFIDIGSMMIVFGGGLAATMASYPLKSFLGLGKVMGKAYFPPKLDPVGVVNTLVDLGEKARREGILALERELKGIDDPFLIKAIQLAVDGNEVEVIESVMGTEIEYIEARHSEGKAMVDDIAAFAPGFGMIGTLVGLIQMLQNLSDPSNIGAGMAIALITTFYGSLFANGIFTPIANKLGRNSKAEVLLKNMSLAGILSIQSGDNPRVLREKLETFIAPALRKAKE